MMAVWALWQLSIAEVLAIRLRAAARQRSELVEPQYLHSAGIAVGCIARAASR